MVKIEEADLKFIECDACAAKPGSPRLCAGCLQNRLVIEQLLSERPMGAGVKLPICKHAHWIGEPIGYTPKRWRCADCHAEVTAGEMIVLVRISELRAELLERLAAPPA